MGYWPLGLAEAGGSLLLTAILFSGPLYETLLVDGAWRQWLSLQPVSDLREWIRWRNIIAVRTYSPLSSPFLLLSFPPSHRIYLEPFTIRQIN